ncbi:hypothetical protein CEXT_731881 [Caerostris extrusa]|uniref:Uncharacterized protein n=1 Tax=Caerostris extrusa TaxID=172846 RepID=A0AAV4WTX3_CAEEX|nr:hypothetical protein CEXT_731881 [Caerostris extrusa]
MSLPIPLRAGRAFKEIPELSPPAGINPGVDIDPTAGEDSPGILEYPTARRNGQGDIPEKGGLPTDCVLLPQARNFLALYVLFFSVGRT